MNSEPESKTNPNLDNEIESKTMNTHICKSDPKEMGSKKLATLELKVINHPGVMMHVVSLFARRAFNLEGIACFPSRDGIHSRIWLRVFEDDKLPQIQLQLEKLIDVVSVALHSATHEAFQRMETFFAE